ncbi:MAG: RraA family protein, partial [Bacillota bacterium]
MASWNSEQELFALMKETLYTPVVGEILDAMGCVHQFLPPELRPMNEGMTLAG